MKAVKLSLFCVLCFLICVIRGYASEESLTITTYYPSPYGSYRELRSQRIAIGDDYIQGSAYCWEGESGCDTSGGRKVIPSATDLVVQGNVGIGTTGPQRKLDIVGSFRVQQESESVPSTPGSGLEIWYDAVNNVADILSRTYTGSNTYRDIRITGNTINLRLPSEASGLYIETSGNVGIGTTAPSQKLDVTGNAVISGTIRGATYGFGGMFTRRISDNFCDQPNPFIGNCGCPNGFSQAFVGGLTACIGGQCQNYYCYK